MDHQLVFLTRREKTNCFSSKSFRITRRVERPFFTQHKHNPFSTRSNLLHNVSHRLSERTSSHDQVHPRHLQILSCPCNRLHTGTQVSMQSPSVIPRLDSRALQVRVLILYLVGVLMPHGAAATASCGPEHGQLFATTCTTGPLDS